ncbi:MAG: 50S ribosomal protein L22 [Candidatus Omnitrophica bacterium]|nr:50S ribosomal protein L22 [Candidatus Omnitrophota bacterium]
MVAKAETKYIRIPSYKAGLLIDLIKREKVERASAILEATNKKGAYYLGKILKSAIANAKNKGYSEDSLFVSKVVVNSGPSLKRFRAASFGRATVIRKKTSHISIELDSPEKLIGKTKIK